MPFIFTNPIGRLVQVHMHGLMTIDEAQQIRTSMYLLLSALPRKAVILTDMVEAEQFSAEVGDRMLEMLMHDNPKVERTGFIMKKGPFSYKVERICLDAARAAKAADKVPPQRRVFFDKSSVLVWLSETLTSVEQAQLRVTISHIP